MRNLPSLKWPFFSDPVHEFDTSDGDRGFSEPLQAKHRTQAKFDRSMILFNEVFKYFFEDRILLRAPP